MLWGELYEILFHEKLLEEKVHGWEEWLDEQFRKGVDKGWTSEELKSALNAYAEIIRKDGRRMKAPTAPEIKTQIIRGRWKRGYKEDINPNEEVCGLCNNIGLVKVYPEAIDPPWTMERLAHEYQRTTPCQCKAGKKIQRFQSFETAVFNLAKQQNIALLSHIR